MRPQAHYGNDESNPAMPAIAPDREESQQPSEYVFDNAGEVAAKRYHELSVLYDAQTIRHLEQRGIGEGWSCLEVGGGGGSIACWLCRRVGPGGRVLATDIEPHLLQILSFSNLEVRCHDIRLDGLANGQFDLAHARLVLMHLLGREVALKRMIAALKPGGWLVVEEFDGLSILANSTLKPAEQEPKLVRACYQVLIARGVEMRYGRALPRRFRANGLINVGAEASVSLWRGRSPGTEFFKVSFEELADPILRAGLMTEAEIEADMQRLDDDDFLMLSPLMWTAWGKFQKLLPCRAPRAELSMKRKPPSIIGGHMYDAIVIGARCAGAITAMLLALHGHRVLLLERGVIPSDVHQGHFIHRHGPKRLAQWGLLQRVVGTNCPPITRHLTDFGDFPLVARDIRIANVAWGYGPRRRQLDRVLVEAAIEAGAEFRPQFTVDSLVWDGDWVYGIRGRDTLRNISYVQKARITIGADGKNSLVAREVHAPSYAEVPALTCWYFSYWSGVPSEGFELYLRDRNAIFSFSTNDNLFAIFIAWPIEKFAAVKADIEREFMRVVDTIPGFAERVRGGRREERFYGTADVPNFLRHPFGPGWALVGDAGCHKDPFMALGICDAFRDADFLAEALHEGLAGERSLNEALARYALRRNEATIAEFQENIARARFGPMPADLLQLRAALRGNEEDTHRFVMAQEGMIPREEFFNPENLQRILGGAGSRLLLPAQHSTAGEAHSL